MGPPFNVLSEGHLWDHLHPVLLGQGTSQQLLEWMAASLGKDFAPIVLGQHWQHCIWCRYIFWLHWLAHFWEYSFHALCIVSWEPEWHYCYTYTIENQKSANAVQNLWHLTGCYMHFYHHLPTNLIKKLAWMTFLLAPKSHFFVLKVVCPQYTFSLPDSGYCYFLVFQNACPNLIFICPGQSGKCLCSTLQ